jgi:hypothetical protein
MQVAAPIEPGNEAEGRLSDARFSSAVSRICLAVAFIIAGLGLAVISYGYWPGIMIDDARWQYQQVVDNAYEDWHPPLMAWIWRRLVSLQPGPAPMLILQLLLYWAGFVLIAWWAYRRGHPRLAVALACAGWLPAPLALSGTVTKDALMAGFLLCATGMLLWRDLVRLPRPRIALTFGTLLTLVVASAIRLNAVFACLPLALVALPRSFTRTKFRFVVTSLAAAATFLATGPVFAALLHAEKTDVELSLMIFDLGGITEHSGVSQFPDMGVRDPVAVNHRCYDPVEWDSYSDWAKRRCPLGFNRLQALIDDEDISARKLWLHAIISHPVAYAEHRLAHFNQSSWFLVPEGPDFTAWTQSVPNPWNFRVQQNGVLATISGIADAAAGTPLGWPIFWISLALGAFVLGVATGARGEVLAIAASAFCYGAGYLLVGVATGIRYYFWAMSGAAVAALLVAGELWFRRSRIRRPVIATSAGIVIVPTLMAIAARLTAL